MSQYHNNTICLLVEGSYPYIPGGVSSWVQMLISELSAREFKILSIMPPDAKKKLAYELPENVTKLQTIYLNEESKRQRSFLQHEPSLSDEEIAEIKKFIRFENQSLDWRLIVDTICDQQRVGRVEDFLASKLFWDLLLEFYQANYPREGFNKFFWTIRSMFSTVLKLMQVDLPQAKIYHAVSTGYAGLLGILAQVEYNSSFILTEHGIYAREREEDILKATWVKGIYKELWIDFFYFIAQGAYQQAERIISLFSRSQRIQQELGAGPKKTEVIVNGVDLDRFEPQLEVKSDGEFVLGAILRIVPIKDVITLIKAFKIVNQQIEQIKLYLIGPYDEDLAYYEECKRLIETFGLTEQIIITGRVDIQEYLAQIDLLVLTSISEGQPLVILESFAAGIPVVATDVGACKELLLGGIEEEIGPAGIITKPVAPVSTAEAIIKLANDHKLRSQMVQNARERVEKYYSKEDLIAKYDQLYKEVGEE